MHLGKYQEHAYPNIREKIRYKWGDNLYGLK